MGTSLMIFGGYPVSLIGGLKELNGIQDHSGTYPVSGLKAMMQ